MPAIHSVSSDPLQAAPLATAAAAVAVPAQASVPRSQGEDTLTLSAAATQAQKGQAPDPSAITPSSNPTYKGRASA